MVGLWLGVFSQEGVGDTPDSYAYDGNRVRKWNVTTTNYGKVSSDADTRLRFDSDGKTAVCVVSRGRLETSSAA